MTVKETAEYFQLMVNGYGAYELCPCFKEDMEMAKIALSALEKQIPKKIDSWTGKCTCGEFIGDYTINFCPQCGQKLDWSEENER